MTGPVKLFFLRHGLADRSAYQGGDDRLRPLTPRGVTRMRAEAVTLARLGLGRPVILTSPLTRCRQTAAIAAAALNLDDQVCEDDRLAPGFDLEDLDAILAEHPDRDTFLLVGHEPDFSWVVSELTGGSAIVFKKGGLARVDLLPRPPVAGDLVWLIPPKVLVL
jgi:phosphohistidine phosphatase